MKAKYKIALGVLILLVLFIFLRPVSSKVICSGKHNIQAKGIDLPETSISPVTGISKVFVLPEISDFKDLYGFKSYRLVAESVEKKIETWNDSVSQLEEQEIAERLNSGTELNYVVSEDQTEKLNL